MESSYQPPEQEALGQHRGHAPERPTQSQEMDFPKIGCLYPFPPGRPSGAPPRTTSPSSLTGEIICIVHVAGAASQHPAQSATAACQRC